METLNTIESQNENCLMSQLFGDLNSYNETLEKASGLSSLGEMCSGSVSDPLVSVIGNGGGGGGGAGVSSSTVTVIGNVEVVNNTFDIEKRVEGAEGGGSVGKVAGTIENGKSCFDFGKIHKGSLVDGAFVVESHMKGGFLEPDLEDRTLAVPRGCEMTNGDVLVLDSCSTGNGDEEIVAERVLTTRGLEEIDASQLNGAEVSRNGISLFVDVFGPLEDIDQRDDSNCVGEHSNFNLEDECKENDTLFRDTGENTSAMVSEIHESEVNRETGQEVQTIGNQECRFSLGDFVWAKIKTHLWWPGLICDPSHAPDDAAKSNKRECFLVRYVGNGAFVQCVSSQLKPFLEYFEQMSRQSNSRSFLSAVDKAVGEIGTCVKLEMTCSCFPKEHTTTLADETKECDTMPGEKKGELGEFSVKRFEAANFLAYVKDLAKDVSIPGVIESTVTQNRLSAFYRTIGHRQLPMHQLMPTTDATGGANDKAEDHSDSKSTEGKVSGVENDDFGKKIGKSANGYELRERRKSKYLSPPFIKLSEPKAVSHAETDMNSTCGQSVGSDPMVKCRGKKSQKKRSGKPVNGHDILSQAEQINASSAEMLLELRFAALDCLYPHGRKYFDMAERFFSRFRRTVFCNNFNHEIASEHTVDLEHCSVKVAAGVPDVNKTTQLGSGGKDLLENGHPLPIIKPNKRRREKKQGRTSVGSKNKPTADLSDVKGNIAASGSVIIDFQKTGPLTPESQSVPKKRKKAGAAPVSTATNPMDGLSDMKGNISTSGSMVIDFQKMRPITPEGQSVPKKMTKKAGATPASSKSKHTAGLLDLNANIAANGPVIIDFKKTVPFSPEGQSVLQNGPKNAAVTPVLPHIKEITDLSGFNGNDTGLLLEDFQFTGFAAPQGKLEPKRRKEKEGIALKPFDSKSSVALPDVKGSSAKFVPVLKDMQVTAVYSVKSIPKVSGGEGLKEATLLNTNTELTANKPDVNGNNSGPGSFVKDTQQMSMLSSGVKPESKKRKRKEKKSECVTKVASAIPDLNKNTTEPNSTDCVMPEAKSQPKKRRNKAAASVVDMNFNCDKVQADVEALGTALLLKFATEFSVPSKEALVSTFGGFGQLKESETLASCESSSAQVVFMRSCDARDAFLSLKNSSPFGPALVNYRLHQLSATAFEADGNMRVPIFLPIDGLNNPVKPKASRKPKSLAKPKTAAKSLALPVPKTPAKAPPGLKAQQGEAPDLLHVRHNLEIMTSMMEKAGNNLSPQIRAKLEGEINGLLKKVRTMEGSS